MYDMNISLLLIDFHGRRCQDLCSPGMTAVVYGWILFCSTFRHHICAASLWEVPLTVGWWVCLRDRMLQRNVARLCWSESGKLLLVDLRLDLFCCFMIRQCSVVWFSDPYKCITDSRRGGVRCICSRLFIWLPERRLLKIPHTDGGETTSRR